MKIYQSSISKILAILFILLLSENYIHNIYSQEIKVSYGTLSSKDIVMSQQYDHFRNIKFYPFEVNTKQEVYIKEIGFNENSLIIDYKIIYYSNETIPIVIRTFLEKNTVIGFPKIKYNNKDLIFSDINNSRRNNIVSQDAGEFNRYYEIEGFNLSGQNKIDILEIEGLKIYVEPHKLTERSIPIFFSDNYYLTYTLPTIIPILIGKDKASDEFVYRVKVPQFKQIEKKSSGWMNASFNSINKPLFSGFINQSIMEEDDTTIFKTKVDLNNLPYTFDMSFVPSWKIFLFILLFFWIPLTLFLLNKFINLFKDMNLITESYLILIGFLGLGTISDLNYSFNLIGEISQLINFVYLMFIFLFPVIFYIIFKNDIHTESV